MEKTIDQVQEVGSGFFDTAQRVFGIVSDALKPGVDAALPIVKQAGDQALKIASPAISEASKKAQEAIQGSGIDTQPVLSAAKVGPFNFSASFFFPINYGVCFVALKNWALQACMEIDVNFIALLEIVSNQ